MAKNPSRIRHVPTTFASTYDSWRSNQLRYGGGITMENWLGFAHMELNYWHCVNVCYKQEFATMFWV